ncbi:MAG: hypothetical protein AB1486_07040 [Planctomycetota bacterium]
MSTRQHRSPAMRALAVVALGALFVIGFGSARAAEGYRIDDYEIGVAYPVISSTYEMSPQIQVLPSEPHPRLIPAPKTPPEQPEVKKYGGWQGTQQTPWAPPDPTLAVGPGHVVETVNMNIAWWRKDGTLEFSAPLDNTGNPGFFEDVGGGSFTFDPKCYYDQHSGRFVVLALEYYSDSAYITFAVSDDSDPNGTWYKYRTDAKTNVSGSYYWVDYPGLGGDEQAIYVCGNLFGFSSGFAGVKYRVFDKVPLLSGQPVVYFDLRDGSAASAQVSYQVEAGRGTFLVSTYGSTLLRVQTIENPLTAPSLVTTTVAVDSFAPPGNAPTLGGSSIDTLDGRIMNVYSRDNLLYAAHAVGSPSWAIRSVCRWYELDLGAWPASGGVTVVQQGNVDFGTDVWGFFPAVARNAAGEVALVMARSGTYEYPSIWYARRFPSDQPGIMQVPLELKAGESGYSSYRWGDYFDIAVDPVDDLTFWGIGEYAITTSSWSTWISPLEFGEPQYCPSPCVEPVVYGSGTPGTGGIVPQMRVAACPTTGNKGFIVAADDFLPGSMGVCFIGLKSAQTDMGGWTLLVQPFLSIAVGYGNGSATVNLPIPKNPFLDGLRFFVQFTANDPGAPSGVAASNAVQNTICYR